MSSNLSKRFFKKPQPDVIVLKPKKLQFPSISLGIPDVFSVIISQPLFLSAFICGVLSMAIGIIGFTIRQNLGNLEHARGEKTIVVNQIKQWNTFLEAHGDYRDGWYTIATLEYRLGDKDAAKKSVAHALQIDPEFKEGKMLVEKIEE